MTADTPQTEAGRRLLNWSAYDGVARLDEILAIEAEARAAGLRDEDALRKYGTHLTSCACRVWTLPQPPCDCGLEEALAAPGAAPAREYGAPMRELTDSEAAAEEATWD